MAHHPPGTRSESDSTSPDVKERVFITSVEMIEFSALLEQNEKTSKWGWLFRTHMQWHLVAFVLSELCIRPSGPTYDRAWKAVENVFDKRILVPTSRQKGMLWKPLRQLWVRAKKVREKQLENNPWSDIVQDPKPEFQRPFGPNGAVQGAPPSDGDSQFNISVIHSTADALGMDMAGFQHEGADGDLEPQMPLPPVMDGSMGMGMDMNGTTVLPEGYPMVQSWLAAGDSGMNQELQSNNDFLRWTEWGDFALSTDPMAGFPVLGPGVVGGGQEWY